MKNKCITVLSVLIVIVTLFIFFNSLRKGEQSMQTSDALVSINKPIVDKIFGENDFDLSYVIRKAAHIIEFCVLGIFTFALAMILGKQWYGYAFFYVLGVGVADEYIQDFTARTSMVRDVLIDFAGAMIGFSFVLIFCFLRNNRKKRKFKN